MTGRAGKVTPIGEIIHGVFARIENEKNLSKEDIDSLWKEACGSQAAGHSTPVTLKKGVLMVWVDSSGWMQELSMRKREILKALKRKLGKDKISEIHLKIGEF